MNERQLTGLARRVARALIAHDLKIVFAESCTGGLVSAALTRIPGVSRVHCGSAVAYQIATKFRWLRIPRSLLRDPGPVSGEVASLMAQNILEMTPHADVSAAVTGHLGPDAPPSQDGLVYIAFARRQRRPRKATPVVRSLDLTREPGDRSSRPLTRRLRRQRSAAAHLLALVLHELDAAD